jgi:RNA polymerase sigma factor (sigma-70 family)
VTVQPPDERDLHDEFVAFVQARQHRLFAAALAKLTVKQRAVLVLRYFDDLSEARTAEVLGVTIGTVKSQTNAALRRLRQVAPELGELISAGSED